MTRERDRIQENANEYIVRNCPATYENYEDKFVCTTQIKQNGFPCYCQDCTDCVIKRVIDLCNNNIRPNETNLYKAGRMSLAVNIVGLFNIEEINK